MQPPDQEQGRCRLIPGHALECRALWLGALRKVPGRSPISLREPRSGFSLKARGYAVRGVTPGMVGKCATTPKVVPTGAPTGFGAVMIPGTRFGTETSFVQRKPIPFRPCLPQHQWVRTAQPLAG